MTEQRWLRILSISFVMYTIAYIDRTNVSMALPAMSAELHMDPRQAGDAVGVFFWGYLLLQMPAGYLAQHWSAKRVVGILLVAHWFPRAERARANAYWMLCLPLSVVISSPLSGWLLTHWNWRVLLVVEGALPFLWLLIWLRTIDDFPKKAKWISAGELQYLERTLAAEAADSKPQERVSYLAALLSPQVLILTAIYFLRNFGSYGSLFWLPTALNNTRKLSDLTLGNIITIPYVLAAILMVAAAKSSDRTGERRAHMSLTLIVSGVSFLAALATQRFPFVSFTLISLAVAAVYASLGPFWALPTETLPLKVVATAMGLINAIGNLGGYFGPVVVGHFLKQSGGFVYGFGSLGIALIIAAAMAFMLRPAQPAVAATVSC